MGYFVGIIRLRGWLKRMSEQLSIATIKRMYQMYLNGNSMKQVGFKFGVSKQRVSQLFIKHNFKRRLPHHNGSKKRWS